ncbi:UNVERIFIED_CONTAM: WAT1-related protein [Sesamum radiatum]|uniref:WAT1-related protein n=1 Tax=Sesamum radiatum TaxID=300843 RepID=A0AAW2TX89_SESRA
MKGLRHPRNPFLAWILLLGISTGGGDRMGKLSECFPHKVYRKGLGILFHYSAMKANSSYAYLYCRLVASKELTSVARTILSPCHELFRMLIEYGHIYVDGFDIMFYLVWHCAVNEDADNHFKGELDAKTRELKVQKTRGSTEVLKELSVKTSMKSFAKWYPVIAMIAIDQAFAISNILLKKIVADGINRWVFITYRQLISAVFLSPLAFFLERGSRPKLTLSILCGLFVSAIIGASVTQYLFLLGLEYTSATFSCAFLNMVPVITFLMALPFGFERVNIKYSSGRAKVVGALVCLGGAILLTVYKGMPLIHFSDPQSVAQSMEQHVKLDSHVGRERWAIGSVALFAGTLCWSSWFLLQTNIGKRYPCQYSSTAIMASFSAVQSAILTLSIDRELSVWILKRKSDIFIILYAKRGPVFTAAFSPLVQIMAATVDVPILHEQLHLGSLIGSVTVIAGLYILLWGKDREMQKQEQKLVQGTEEIKDQEQELQVIKLSVESGHP